MAVKVLGQAAPAAATLSTLYTVPVARQAVTSTLTACNTGTTAATFRVRVAIGGAADSVAQAVYQDVNVPANDTYSATIGMTLAAGDVVRVQASAATLSFNLFGNETAVTS